MNKAELQNNLDSAKSYMAQGLFIEAKSILLNVTDSFPESAEGWKELGVAELKLNNLGSATDYLTKSLDIDDTDIDAWSSLGSVYISMHNYEEAKTCYEKGISIDPNNTYALLNFLTLQSVIGEIEPILKVHNSSLQAGKERCAIQISEKNNIPWCYYDMAQILFFGGDWDGFQANIKAAVSQSAPWQIDSSLNTYKLLAQSGALLEKAQKALATIAKLRT